MTGLALQAISIPLVFHSLGPKQYELYILLTALLATIALVQMGAGPGLTQGIARANAAQNREDEAALLQTAFRIALIACTLGAAVIMTVIHVVPPGQLFGASFAHDRSEVISVSDICVFVLMAQIVAGVVDSALAGYQEQVFSNLGQMVANVLSIAALFLVCKYAPSIINVVCVSYGAPMLSRIVNMVVLLQRRPYLIRGLFRSCKNYYGTLMGIGAAFWAIQVSGVIEAQAGTYVLAHLSSTRTTDTFSMVFRYVGLAGSVVTILTQPLWPAFADAVAHHDVAWMKRSFSRIRLLLTAYSVAVALVMSTAGPWICQHILHLGAIHDMLLFWILSLYLVANVWTHLVYTTMMGMPGIWRVAVVILCERTLLIVFGIILVPKLGGAGMALSYLLASLVLPAWVLPRLMKSEIKRIANTAASESLKTMEVSTAA